MSSTNDVGNEMLGGSSKGVFEIPGEPAIVINGLPDTSTAINDVSVNCGGTAAEESDKDKGFGEWLEGREVRKLFGNEYYSGVVTGYDVDEGWYRVVYDDGDFEDLDWQELEEVIVPLDIMVPMKALALKVVKKDKKSEQGLVASRSRERRGKNASGSNCGAVLKPEN